MERKPISDIQNYKRRLELYANQAQKEMLKNNIENSKNTIIKKEIYFYKSLLSLLNTNSSNTTQFDNNQKKLIENFQKHNETLSLSLSLQEQEINKLSKKIENDNNKIKNIEKLNTELTKLKENSFLLYYKLAQEDAKIKSFVNGYNIFRADLPKYEAFDSLDNDRIFVDNFYEDILEECQMYLITKLKEYNILTNKIRKREIGVVVLNKEIERLKNEIINKNKSNNLDINYKNVYNSNSTNNVSNANNLNGEFIKIQINKINNNIDTLSDVNPGNPTPSANINEEKLKKKFNMDNIDIDINLDLQKEKILKATGVISSINPIEIANSSKKDKINQKNMLTTDEIINNFIKKEDLFNNLSDSINDEIVVEECQSDEDYNFPDKVTNNKRIDENYLEKITKKVPKVNLKLIEYNKEKYNVKEDDLYSIQRRNKNENIDNAIQEKLKEIKKLKKKIKQNEIKVQKFGEFIEKYKLYFNDFKHFKGCNMSFAENKDTLNFNINCLNEEGDTKKIEEGDEDNCENDNVSNSEISNIMDKYTKTMLDEENSSKNSSNLS